ncbi:hypothetical protein LEMLEM_LOCUS10464, partial [Lemmus lemmus]
KAQVQGKEATESQRICRTLEAHRIIPVSLGPLPLLLLGRLRSLEDWAFQEQLQSCITISIDSKGASPRRQYSKGVWVASGCCEHQWNQGQ